MKKLLLSLSLLTLLFSSCVKPEGTLTYNAQDFSIEFSPNWAATDDGHFINEEPAGSIKFTHLTSDFDAPIYEDAGTENYISSQGINWVIHYSQVADEFLDLYPKSFRFTQVSTQDKSFEGSVFLYQYDEELNPDAVDQLKEILDSYRAK